MLYHYQRSRRHTAGLLALNMLVLGVFYGVLHHLTAGEPRYGELLNIARYGLVAVELALAGAIAWLLAHPATFEIRVSEREFTIVHPTFSRWNFSVNPQDILCIKQIITGIDFRQEVRQLVMRDGRTFEICPNYRYSRKALYAALHKANPSIQLPENPHYFKVRG